MEMREQPVKASLSSATLMEVAKGKLTQLITNEVYLYLKGQRGLEGWAVGAKERRGVRRSRVTIVGSSGLESGRLVT